MIIKELFEGPVGDYCIARNTIKCLLFLSQILDIEGVLRSCLKGSPSQVLPEGFSGPA